MHALLYLSLLGAPTEPSPCADHLFELPSGFHIIRVATAKESGGSYDIAFDGEGRLLAGDGQNVRRLSDSNKDGIYDGHEVIAKGLGPRGPQGLLVLGDRLYAVGGDGIQLFTGYESGGPLVHRGRIGQPFGTGGDHDAHTVLPGHDGYVWFITGDGGGARDRVHITEDTSPAIRERSASVFRFAPEGDRWECFATGGRNPPNLGMNWLGELFSLDSDMEWHVDLPWWRPVRLNHWIAGGDQGWQEVGAYPPYYIDCLPGILDVGRGSPDWGVFYEHTAFPARYRDAYFVCDYPSKSATTGGYETAGRLFVFFLERSGAGWKASHEVFAKPAPKREGKEAPSFALVDVEVAPDGSLFLSDHNQGIWRIFHGEDGCRPPPIVPEPQALPSATAPLIDELLALPQPAAERSRKRAREILSRLGPSGRPAIEAAALDAAGSIGRRIRAIRLLAPDAGTLGVELLAALSKDAAPEVRAQAAWLIHLRGKDAETDFLARLLDDPDPFVRRRAAEAATRHGAPGIEGKLLERLVDPERLVRYASMVALAKRPAASWLPRGLAASEPKARMRALIASDLRREPPPDAEVRESVVFLLGRLRDGASKEDRLDLLRILGKFRRSIEGGAEGDLVKGFLLESFPDPDRDVRRELARLIGEYRIPGGFRELLAELAAEQDPIAQFHLAQALARIREGWSADEEERAIEWFLGTQKGWFAEPAGKGLQFPHFWATVVSEMAAHHQAAMLRALSRIDIGGPLGGVAIDLVAGSEDPVPALMALAKAAGSAEDARRRILRALGRATASAAREFLREEYLRDPAPETRGIILRGLASAPPDAATRPLLIEGLRHENREVVQACLGALAKAGGDDERLASNVLAILARRIDLFRDAERALVAMGGTKRPGYEPEERDRPGDGEIDAGQLFWKAWYAEKFGKEFDPASVLATEEKEDEAVRDFLLSDRAGGGNAERGSRVYEAARCATCHGGLGKEGERLFGPDLAGVTRRLAREEVVDAIVVPSKVVADRFKAVLVQTEGGATITGFITERTEEEVIVADQERVHRLRASEVEAIHPLDTSLMPERLLNRSSWEEIRDLWAFMDTLGRGAPDPGGPREASDWPGWRGPGGRGISPEQGLPERWSTTEGIAWKVDLPGWGNSSPVVVGNRVYVTTQTPDESLHVLALDRDTGKVIWDRIAGKGKLKAHELHNMATPTPTAAAEGVWALFGTGDLVHLDTAGEVVWRRNLPEKHGEYRILWGMGSSPVLHGDLLYLMCLHKGPSYVLAVDRRTGMDVWKTPRDLPCREEAADSYSSPFVLEEGGKAELIVSGAEHITAYDLRSGELLWTVPGVGIDHDYGRTMASPTGSRGIVVGVSASVQGLGQMVGARGGAVPGEGASRKLWRFDKFTPDCPTPIIVGDVLHVLRDDGIGTALDLETGKKHWQKRLGRGNYKASPASGDGKIYYLGWEGFCVVLRPGAGGEVIAENEIDDAFIASPAISGGKLFFKGKKSLWAVGPAKKAAKAGPATGLLRIHPENPRYFTDGTRTPSGSLRAVYLTGSHTWNNLVDMGRSDPPEPFDYDAYLAFLERHGHNFIRLWAWDSTFWDTRANGPLGKDFLHRAAPLPWLRTGPENAFDGKPRFDLTKFDPIYFERLRDRVKAAGRRGIHVSVMLFEGWGLLHGNRGRKGARDGWAWRSHPFNPVNNVNGISPPGAGDVTGRVHALGNAAMNDLQAAYVRKVVDTVNDLDNVLYEVINEGGEQDWNRWVLKTIREHERTKAKQHPIGLTGHGADDLESMITSEADWVSPGGRDGYKDDPPAWKAGPKKPSLLDTDHIWGVGGSVEWVWKALLRGHNPIFMDPYDGSVLGDPASKRWEPIRSAMGAARRLVSKVDLARMEPRNDLASTGYCLAEPGKAYAVYLPSGTHATVDLTGAAGELETEWIRPEGGDAVRGRIEGGGKRELSVPPWTGESGAVILIRRAAPREL